MFFLKKSGQGNKGFTIVELMVSVGIFALMTALLLAKYGTFNQGILLTNLAYDLALTIRNAQSYGVNVKSAPTGIANYSNEFNLPYGVYIDDGVSIKALPKNEVVFFVDLNNNQKYDPGATPSELISKYTMKRGSYVSSICVNQLYSCGSANFHNLHLTFVRPDPRATIKSDHSSIYLVYAEIVLKSSDGKSKKVTINDLGQIVIKD